MNSLKIPMFLFVLVTTLTPAWALEPQALTPNDILQRIERAQASVNTLPTDNQSLWSLWVAVSFSMPKASLSRLATDAGAAQIPLVFRGVGTQPDEYDRETNEPPQTQLERYGKGFLARHLTDFEPLIKEGAAVKLDPKRFEKASVTDVPRLILMRENRERSASPLYFTARGDVTLRFALEFLMSELKNTPSSKLADSDRKEALRVLDSALNRLVERA